MARKQTGLVDNKLFQHTKILTVEEEINKLHNDISSGMKDLIDKAVQIGKLLSQKKKKVKHGEWIPWVKDNLVFNERQAQKYMQLYEKRTLIKKISNTNCNSYLGIDNYLNEVRKIEGTKKPQQVEAFIEDVNEDTSDNSQAYISSEKEDPFSLTVNRDNLNIKIKRFYEIVIKLITEWKASKKYQEGRGSKDMLKGMIFGVQELVQELCRDEELNIDEQADLNRLYKIISK